MAQVLFKGCDVKTTFVTHVPCTSCAAIKKQTCPSGWLRELPDQITQDCRYEVQLGGSMVSMSGCRRKCRKQVVQKACCPGYWGSRCYECPGGAETPCNGHGTCLDGMDRNGTCVCQENFRGAACQECQDPNRFGPDCQSGECLQGKRAGPVSTWGPTQMQSLQPAPICHFSLCPSPSDVHIPFRNMCFVLSHLQPFAHATPLRSLLQEALGEPQAGSVPSVGSHHPCVPASQLCTLKVVPARAEF